MTAEALPAISRILRQDPAPVESFVAIEQRAHEILPGLGAIRPTVGGTPLVPVPSRDGTGRIWLKIESANATGTVKARTAYALICTAIARTGRSDVRLVEYSGGSLALALAEFSRILGLDLHLVVPDGSPQRLRQRLSEQGATVSSGVRGAGFLGAMEAAAAVAEDEQREFLLQHSATAVVAMHREHTGAELINQLSVYDIDPLALVGSVGSGGSLIGTGLALWEKEPARRVLAVFPTEAPYADPDAPAATRRMNGTGGLGYGLRQPLLRPYEKRLEFVMMPYSRALEGMRHLLSAYGISACSSGAGAWLAASEVVDTVGPGAEAVALIAGRGTVEEWDHAGGR